MTGYYHLRLNNRIYDNLKSVRNVQFLKSLLDKEHSVYNSFDLYMFIREEFDKGIMSRHLHEYIEHWDIL